MQITLLFPDALLVAPNSIDPVCALARRVFARAQLINESDDQAAVPLQMPWERWLRDRFSLPERASVEAASLFQDVRDRGPAHWWRVSPVHLHLGLDHVVLHNPTELHMSAEQARGLADAIAPTLAQAGLGLTIAHPQRWYLRSLDGKPGLLDELDAKGWRAASGRNIEPYSPTGSRARHWRGLITEIQMTWHEHPINRDREAKGLPAINSLWLDGLAQAATESNFDVLFSDLVPVAGLVSSVKPRPAISADAVSLSAATAPLRLHDPAQFGRSDLRANARVLFVADSSNFTPTETDAAAVELWRYLADSIATAQTLSVRGGKRPDAFLRVVLSGNRRLIELDMKPQKRFAFWRKLDPKPWFEWQA